MSLKLQKMMSLMIAVFVAFGMLVVNTGEANAASGKVKVGVSGNYQSLYLDKENSLYVGEEGIAYANHTKGNKVIVKSVKVSDKSIATVKKDHYNYGGKRHKYYYVVGKRPGKVKVSIKYKFNGKTSTKSKTVTVEEYPKAILSLTVNEKNIAVTGKHAFNYNVKYGKSKTKAKIKVVPAEGWKITGVDGVYAYEKGKDIKYNKVKKVKSKVKKGEAIPFAKKYKEMYLEVILENRDGENFFYNIYLHR